MIFVRKTSIYDQTLLFVPFFIINMMNENRYLNKIVFMRFIYRNHNLFCTPLPLSFLNFG